MACDVMSGLSDPHLRITACIFTNWFFCYNCLFLSVFHVSLSVSGRCFLGGLVILPRLFTGNIT